MDAENPELGGTLISSAVAGGTGGLQSNYELKPSDFLRFTAEKNISRPKDLFEVLILEDADGKEIMRLKIQRYYLRYNLPHP